MPRGRPKIYSAQGPNNKLGSKKTGTVAEPELLGDYKFEFEETAPSPLDILIEREEAELAAKYGARKRRSHA